MACHLERMETTFCSRVEMVGGTEFLAQLGCMSTRQLDGLLVAQRQTERLISSGLGNHGDGDRSSKALMEVPNKAVSNAKQLIGR